MDKTFLKYYPFWLGLIACVFIIGLGVQHGGWSFCVIGAYLIGYFKMTKFH